MNHIIAAAHFLYVSPIRPHAGFNPELPENSTLFRHNFEAFFESFVNHCVSVIPKSQKYKAYILKYKALILK